MYFNPSFVPASYVPVLDVRETHRAIAFTKALFGAELADALRLTRVEAPLFVQAGTGVNDDLNGLERPVSFRVPALGAGEVQIVQSLAKWKRLALAAFGFEPGTGLCTDMRAIRPDETLDHTHSAYVDQWDWERVMRPDERTLAFLEATVRAIYGALRRTSERLAERYPRLGLELPDEVTLVTAEELEARYPSLSRAEREDRIARDCGAVFVAGIGASLRDGRPHDGRAPDYDDWTTRHARGRGLNGDLIVWHPVTGRALELSSMGIRVTPETLVAQLAERGCPERAGQLFHRRLLAGELPQSVGGGIGQSRVCMYLLRKAHIGEVQASVWPEPVLGACRARNVTLL